VGDQYYVALGTSLGWYGLNFGSGSVILENPMDNTYNAFVANGTRANLFDINAGAMFYGERLFAGYSVYQIGENQIELGNEGTPAGLTETRLALHQYAMFGYRFSVSDQVDLTPSTLFKLRGPAPASFDINLRADFDQRIFAGLSYRSQDAVSVMAGLIINDWLQVGYAYDYITSSINNLSSGSHEIVLGFQFDRK
jgi:type IX secretion system PorP/SprF family membrane protein